MLKLKIMGVSFSINEGINGKGGMQWTKDLGFDTYVTNTVYNSGTQAVPVSLLRRKLSGYRFCGQTACHQNLPLTGSRATQVDGGLIYGYKVIKPKELVKATLTYGPETVHITLR